MVDKHNLDREWTDQPGAMHYVLIEWAEKLQERKETEAKCERIMAEQDEVIRKGLEDRGEKATETAIKRLLIASPQYQQAIKERDEAAHILHLVEAERTALEHKKTALENLTKLRLSDWYSEPKQQRSDQYNDSDKEDQIAGLKKKVRSGKKRPERV